MDTTKIAVIGLGYVGLPLAVQLAKNFIVTGFDINKSRIDELKEYTDSTLEVDSKDLQNDNFIPTHQESNLNEQNIYIVTVPTPITKRKTPDLSPIMQASQVIGRNLSKNAIVVYESTVYPGVTEDICGPILEQASGMSCGSDFFLAYSPERINPGDKEHTVDKITKVISGQNEEVINRIKNVYGSINNDNIFVAKDIKTAEAAKVIENAQRDINIAFINEITTIMGKLGISIHNVLDAAKTKWNFLNFQPGLVGGHCIGVDPYYLLHKSKQMGIDPQVILSGRRINDGMPAFIAKRLIQMLIQKGKSPQNAKVLVKGMTFKENVADIRNSKVVELINELMEYSVNVHIVDPHASPNEVAHEYKLTLLENVSTDYDAVIVAVSHEEYKHLSEDDFTSLMGNDSILMDLKSMYKPLTNSKSFSYWSL